MPASLGGQLVIVLGGLVSAFVIIGVLARGIYILIRYIQWINMTIIYVARKTGTPLPKKLLDQYHQLPHNGTSLDHLLTDNDDDPAEPTANYPLPSRASHTSTESEE